MIKNKKGAVVFHLMLMAVVGVASFILIGSSSSNSDEIKFIGSTQQKLMNSHESSLQIIQFIDMSFNLAVLKSLKELSNEPIHYELLEKKTGCYSLVYPVLNSVDSDKLDCFSDYEEEFKFLFRKNLDLLLHQYSERSLIDTANFRLDLSSSSQGLILRMDLIEFITNPIHHEFYYFKDSGMEEILVFGMPRYSYSGVPLVPIQNIPNVICDEKDTSYGKICAGNAELVSQIRKLSEEYLVPKDLTMVITQAYRTYAIQQKFWEDWCLNKNQCNMACNPVRGNCPHMVAGAIDLNLYSNFYTNKKCLNCEGSDAEDINYVFDLMCLYDFVRYWPERWHFEYGTNQWEISQKHFEETSQKRCFYR